jgi:hypothetical protein
MKILHTSDWHLGKRLGEFNRFEEQKEVLMKFSALPTKKTYRWFDCRRFIRLLQSIG